MARLPIFARARERGPALEPGAAALAPAPAPTLAPAPATALETGVAEEGGGLFTITHDISSRLNRPRVYISAAAVGITGVRMPTPM